MNVNVKAYMDLTRLHFFFVWPILFCAGLFLAFQYNDSFSWLLVAQVALIGFLGFEAGLVLNDIVDGDIDKKEVEGKSDAEVADLVKKTWEKWTVYKERSPVSAYRRSFTVPESWKSTTSTTSTTLAPTTTIL